MPEGPRFIAETAAGARETRLLALLALALVAPAILGCLSLWKLASRGPIVCYVPEAKLESTVPVATEFP